MLRWVALAVVWVLPLSVGVLTCGSLAVVAGLLASHDPNDLRADVHLPPGMRTAKVLVGLCGNQMELVPDESDPRTFHLGRGLRCRKCPPEIIVYATDGSVHTFVDAEPIGFCHGQGGFPVDATIHVNEDGSVQTVFQP